MPSWDSCWAKVISKKIIWGRIWNVASTFSMSSRFDWQQKEYQGTRNYSFDREHGKFTSTPKVQCSQEVSCLNCTRHHIYWAMSQRILPYGQEIAPIHLASITRLSKYKDLSKELTTLLLKAPSLEANEIVVIHGTKLLTVPAEMEPPEIVGRFNMLIEVVNGLPKPRMSYYKLDPSSKTEIIAVHYKESEDLWMQTERHEQVTIGDEKRKTHDWQQVILTD